jgi:hypothetical protein
MRIAQIIVDSLLIMLKFAIFSPSLKLKLPPCTKEKNLVFRDLHITFFIFISI